MNRQYSLYDKRGSGNSSRIEWANTTRYILLGPWLKFV